MLPFWQVYFLYFFLAFLPNWGMSVSRLFLCLSPFQSPDDLHFQLWHLGATMIPSTLREGDDSNCRVMSHPSCCCFWGFQEILCDINMIRQGMGRGFHLSKHSHPYWNFHGFTKQYVPRKPTLFLDLPTLYWFHHNLKERSKTFGCPVFALSFHARLAYLPPTVSLQISLSCERTESEGHFYFRWQAWAVYSTWGSVGVVVTAVTDKGP